MSPGSETRGEPYRKDVDVKRETEVAMKCGNWALKVRVEDSPAETMEAAHCKNLPLRYHFLSQCPETGKLKFIQGT